MASAKQTQELVERPRKVATQRAVRREDCKIVHGQPDPDDHQCSQVMQICRVD